MLILHQDYQQETMLCLLELNADDEDINNTLGSAEYSSEGIAQTENQVIISTA